MEKESKLVESNLIVTHYFGKSKEGKDFDFYKLYLRLPNDKMQYEVKVGFNGSDVTPLFTRAILVDAKEG